MNFLPPEIEDYALEHSQAEPELLAELRRETYQKVIHPRMLSGHYQGRFLSLISKMISPKIILEIGTYTGYSAICLAEGLADSGKIFSLDINDELDWIHEKYFRKSGFENQIQVFYGDACDMIPKLQLKDIDLVFIDADKTNYLNYYEMVLPQLRRGGIILIDNVLWSGKVLEEAEPNDLDTQVLQKLNEKLRTDDRVDQMLLTLRDGLTICRKK